MRNVQTSVKSNQFVNIANLFKALETAAFDNANTVKINNTNFNLSSLADIERIKYLMIGALMQLGITVNEDVINHMLNTNYGGSGWQ
jgi:hypothetical protein